MLQNGVMDTRQEQFFLEDFLAHCEQLSPFDRISLVSGYLNPSAIVLQRLLKLKAAEKDFVTAAPEVTTTHSGK